jgi:hypothetical protein
MELYVIRKPPFIDINKIELICRINIDIDLSIKYIKNIILLFNTNHNKINIHKFDLEDNNILIFIGMYYEFIVKDYEQMKKYYLISIEKGDPKAMNNLAKYYGSTGCNYDLMKKYFLMAIDKNYSDSMNNLAIYYHVIEKNYDLMKKYYLMAIELKNAASMNNLAFYYHDTINDYTLAEKYYLMGIEHNDSCAYFNLGEYYYSIKKDMENTIKYYIYFLENSPDYLHKDTKYDVKIFLFNYQYKFPLSLYKILVKINRLCYINYLFIKLDKNNEVKIYLSKIKYAEKNNNYKQCRICLEDNILNIQLKCKHDICINCYTSSNMKCYFSFCH